MRFFPLLNAILRGSLNANGKKIENLATPTADNDAATKKYVDEHGGGSVTLDDAVTRTSANGVKSSGIWSAIWGALTALPTGVASLYDWVVNALSGKLDKTDVIKQSAVTSSTPDGKAADAKDMKSVLFGKLRKTYNNMNSSEADTPWREDDEKDFVRVDVGGGEIVDCISRYGVYSQLWTIIKNARFLFENSADIDIRGNRSWSDFGLAVAAALKLDVANLAPAYSTTKTGGYAVDEFCSKDGKIYQCISATSGGWDATKWRERNLLSLFSDDNGSGNAWIDGRIASGVPLLITPYTRYDLVDKTAVEGVVTLADRTFNRVAVAAATTFALPTAITGKARDLAIYIKASVAEATLSFDETTNTIRGDDMPVTAVGGEYLVLLTEIDSVNGKTVWNCSVKDITPAA